MRKRKITFAATGGRCFYCGFELQLNKKSRVRRDWLFARPRKLRMIEDHAHPRGRGGTDAPSNLLPSCHSCNSAKASLTVEEFRFCRALRMGNFGFHFHAEPSPERRDWLACHSRSFEAALFRVNYPDGMRAYGRGKLEPVTGT